MKVSLSALIRLLSAQSQLNISGRDGSLLGFVLCLYATMLFLSLDEVRDVFDDCVLVLAEVAYYESKTHQR